MDIFTAFVFLTLVVSTTKAFDPCASPSSESKGSDLSVIHVYGQCSPFNQHKAGSWVNTVINMASKDPARVTYLSSLVASPKATSVPIASGQQVLNIGNYVVRVKLGTPAETPHGSHAPTAPAAPPPPSPPTLLPLTLHSNALCPSAPRSVASRAPPRVLLHASSTKPMVEIPPSPPCSHRILSAWRLTLFPATLSAASTLSPARPFRRRGSWGWVVGPCRCSHNPGLYTLVSSPTVFPVSNHTTSLAPYASDPLGQPKNIRTTPLLRNPHRPTLYYVNLTGVSVGRVLVPVAPELLAFDPNTGAGTIIDSGTVITRFVEPVYAAIRDEFRKQVKGPFATIGAFDTCFAATNEDIAPPVTFHFTGMDLKLPLENTLIHSSAGSLACLAMAAAPNNVNSVLNVIANLQQQNLRIMFDVTNSRLGIARELCN
uniref:Peptidase A1 domain-containing protein n=1 Tax=Vitis vinifera TaxID=29760 RepID=A5B0M6_VITVI|nr:hypothetical protein VITISV_003547 [Vitis vinifera]